MPDLEKQKISVVCPVFNEEEAIPLYYDRFKKALACLSDNYLIELIFVNNCSTDNTLAAIKNIQNKNPTVQYITLTRNFGYQSAIAVGLKYAENDYVCVMDGDLQDPPEIISKFVEPVKP